jgi:hypothetical protein
MAAPNRGLQPNQAVGKGKGKPGSVGFLNFTSANFLGQSNLAGELSFKIRFAVDGALKCGG